MMNVALSIILGTLVLIITVIIVCVLSPDVDKEINAMIEMESNPVKN